MSTKFSRKTFLKGSVAGLGMMALNVCTAGAASAAEPAAAAAEDTNSLNLIPKKAASVKVTSRGSVSGGWQGEPVFPNWKGYTDDTLAMNHMYTFVGYAGQGTLCVEPESGVTGFNLFVNNRQINTAAMAAGGVWNVDISGQTINGRNTIQVGGIRPRGKKVTVRVGYPTVQEGSLQDVGIDRDALELLEQIIQADVNNGFPSAQMAIVKNGKLVYQNAWGKVNSYNPDGTPKGGRTCQGYKDDSFWARGQAWGVYGSAIGYTYTHDEKFLEVFRKALEFYLSRLPEDLVPCWDMVFAPESGEPRDSSSAAIVACGLLEAAKYVDETEAAQWRTLARQMLGSLAAHYAVKPGTLGSGQLLHGTYSKKSPYNTCTPEGVDECTSWGDYFYMEALTRLTKDWEMYW